MRARRSLVFLAAAAAALSASLALNPPAGAADGSSAAVYVSPHRGLQNGDRVAVWATGLPKATPVRVQQCNVFDDSIPASWGCPDLAVVTTSRFGTLFTTVVLRDPLMYNDGGPGAGRAVYCRADTCRIGLLTLPNENDEDQVLAQSAPLIFRGSPATVTAQPSTDLADYQWVHVTGTAYGAEGRLVRVVEHSCYEIIQGTGCYAEAAAVWTRVGSRGGYSVWYLARRILMSDDTPVDCNGTDDFLLRCVISAAVYRRDGTPDNSFGMESYGEPMVDISFRGSPG